MELAKGVMTLDWFAVVMCSWDHGQGSDGSYKKTKQQTIMNEIKLNTVINNSGQFLKPEGEKNANNRVGGQDHQNPNNSGGNQNQEWQAFFNEREAFLKVKLTDKQKESWQRGTIEEAKQALQLRKDLKHIYDKGSCSRKFFKELEHYLKPEYENLEYELNNNGCDNLLEYIDEELNNHDNYWLEKVAKGIKSGLYGEWCAE